MRNKSHCTYLIGVALLACSAPVEAQTPSQTLGPFTWQLQPFCNRVTMAVTQTGTQFTLIGYDDMCGLRGREPLVGSAVQDTSGNINLGFHVFLAAARSLEVKTTLALGAISGTTWYDSAGNIGTFAFGGNAPGPERPSVQALPPDTVTTQAIIDGSVRAADVNKTEVQLRVGGACSQGEFMQTIDADGRAYCNAGGASFAVALGNGAGQGGGSVDVTNVSVGYFALAKPGANASETVAVGTNALRDAAGSGNVAIGYTAARFATGSDNIVVGNSAGIDLTTGSGNILIGSTGTGADNDRIRIGAGQTSAFVAGIRGITPATSAIPVVVGTDGQLGTVSSSRRFKDDVRDMGDWSARIAQLRPVTFRYKQPMSDGSTPLDFGLVAEEVAEVFPELAVRNGNREIETVAYHKLPALLLNELQKQQRVIDALLTRVGELESLYSEHRRTNASTAPAGRGPEHRR